MGKEASREPVLSIDISSKGTKSYEVTQGTSEETVVSHIKSIRDKLKKYDKNFTPIETVTNSGYKFRWRAP